MASKRRRRWIGTETHRGEAWSHHDDVRFARAVHADDELQFEVGGARGAGDERHGRRQRATDRLQRLACRPDHAVVMSDQSVPFLVGNAIKFTEGGEVRLTMAFEPHAGGGILESEIAQQRRSPIT